MKCPKCGYISFDYNASCPKCKRDLTPQREAMNLPSYRPDPPSLLGALLGEPDRGEGPTEVMERPMMEEAQEEDLEFGPEFWETLEGPEPAAKDDYGPEVRVEPRVEQSQVSDIPLRSKQMNSGIPEDSFPDFTTEDITIELEEPDKEPT
jgi:hypothetical protein